jgi:arsenate reductase-like glutaredoxin family protein
MSKSPLTADEIRTLIGDRDYVQFLNPRNDEYRERNMKANPPSREEAVERMAANPNLIRRPLLVLKDDILFGYDESTYRKRFG